MNLLKNIFLFSLLVFAIGCDPVEDPEISLPAPPAAPQFSVTPVADNPNLQVVTDNSVGFFDRLWNFEGGTPSASTKAVDTIFFLSAGSYEITLHASAEGGSGVVSSTQIVNIDADAEVFCDETTSLLTGDCGFEGKCWTFSGVGGAISVGPVAGSTEWYTSPADGLVPEQYDDSFCFFFEGQAFEYRNSGQTVNPYNGYAIEDFTPPTGQTWTLAPGGTTEIGQITLPDASFIGTLDSGPVYDVVTLTETELVLRSPIKNADEGWFEFYFVAE